MLLPLLLLLLLVAARNYEMGAARLFGPRSWVTA
jgi:hypothetical protein